MKRSLTTLAVLAAVSIPAAALSADKGLYISGAGGYSIAHDTDMFSPGAGNTTADFDDGFAVVGAAGYKYASGLRTELELGYRNNDIDSVTPGGTPDGGDFQMWSGILNLIYDFDNSSAFTPYLGGGLGVGYLQAELVNGGPPEIFNDESFLPLAQAIVGVDYAVSNALSVFADYRYLTSLDDDWNQDIGNGPGASGESEFDYDNSTFLLGLRYSFSKPTPAPAKYVAPRRAKSRSYIVFFDYNKNSLSSEAKEIIARAAKDAKSGKKVRFDLVGHADRSGSAAYNLGLSKRRADAVRAELQRQGVNAADIASVAKGESTPLVPTADGAREPQNRRVEIVYTAK